MSRLIDADALSNQMYHEAFETDTEMQRWDSGCWIRYKMFENALRNAPTIEERKTGKWIEFPNHNAYKCSECGRIIETVDGKSNVCKHYPYCHCGAKMEGMTDMESEKDV